MRTIIGAAVLSLSLMGGQQAPEPKITAVTPAAPVVSQKVQTLTVTGEGFRTGMTLFVTTPGGTVNTFAGEDLAAPRPTSFQVSLTLNEKGRYTFVVVNETGPRSTAFAIETKAASTSGPWIEEVMPAEFSRSREVQLVTFAGRNFAQGIRVNIGDPSGSVKTAEVVRVEAQTLVVRFVFEQAGPHEVTLTNPSGESSNAMAIAVN